MPSFPDSRHAPFLFFSLLSKNIHLTHGIRLIYSCWRPLFSRRRRQLPDKKTNSLKHHVDPTIRASLLLGSFRCCWSRRCFRCCWSRRLSRFRFFFGRWRLRSLGFASNSHSDEIDHQSQCEQKKDPLLHVPSPPF